ncbi:hypothetical protein [Vibrio coralliilyticus]|uniref:hypothetical protein n=1 Tax=Vibrio coralliilyticus TaxID=190893 RepID=UPI001E60A10C|nr:hypothetical protein [Vibrio coralliilyticus]MCC2524932.1 hypothetical protein [Vibrio coralliilyticus]
MRSNRCYKKIVLLAALCLPPNSLAFFGGSLTYTIVDPTRDMNWYLKEVKAYFIAAERRLAELDRMVSDRLQTLMVVQQAQANSSAKIIATTTAISSTSNPISEEHYTPTTTGAVCASIDTYNNLLNNPKNDTSRMSACYFSRAKDSLAAKRMSDRFTQGIYADGTYYKEVVSELATPNDKEIISAIAEDIQFYSKTLTEHTLLSEEQLARAQRISDLVFNQGVVLPHPKNIGQEVFPENVATKFNKQFFSNTYKAFIDRNLRDRVSVDGLYAKDTPIIEVHRDQRMVERVTDAANADHAADAQRLLALNISKKLSHNFKRLELALRKQSEASLRIKQFK